MSVEIKDFDRFLREREGGGMRLKVLGREIEAPSELPWWYVLKVERLLKAGTPISGEENAALLRQLLKEEDYDYIVHHPEFRASWFWEIIAFGWLRGGEARDGAPEFRTEDELKVEQTREGRGKNP